MTAARFSWSRCSFVGMLALVVFADLVAAQEPRPLELRSWLTPRATPRATSRIAPSLLSLSGDVTGCTLVRCNQTASMFVTTRAPFGLDLTAGFRMRDLGAEQLGGRSALGSVYLAYDAGPFRVWSGATAGPPRGDADLTPDPAPGIESGFLTNWHRVIVAVSAAGGWLRTPTIGNHVARATPIIRQIVDSTGIHADTIYPPAIGDSTGTSANRWSSTEARITWREERWWITARAGRLASTRQTAAFWAGLQGGAQLSRDVSLLLGVGKSSRALTSLGERSATPHVSLGFGFNTRLLERDKKTRRDSAETNREGEALRPFVLSDLGGGRFRLGFLAARRLRDSTPGRLGDSEIVEIACDCEGWKPKVMTRVGDMLFVEVQATPGVHHVSVRVDGGKWIAPPGLAAIDDDFAGQAGLLVVP